MLINLTNHPSEKWMDDQKNAAQSMFGEVQDKPFPAVPISAGPNDIAAMADEIVAEISNIYSQDNVDDKSLGTGASVFAVMVQGEFTLTYAIVSRLKAAGITVVSAVSERIVTVQEENGIIKKTAIFKFAGFREYI